MTELARRGVRASIRWKLFALISVAAAVPVAGISAYLESREEAVLDAELSTKAAAYARVLGAQAQSAVAFDDVETAREIFGSLSLDGDIAYLALHRADGSVLESRGSGDDAPVALVAAAAVSRPPGRIRVTQPVVSSEGPRGTLVVELTTARVSAAVAHVRLVGALVAALALLVGCLAAWMVGTSFGRRIRRVEARAHAVVAGDLSDSPLADGSDDEIGSLARAFQNMVRVVDAKVEERTRALAASREQMQRLLDATRTVPWQVDPDTLRATYVGGRATELFGVDGDSLTASGTWSERIEPADYEAWTKAVRATQADGQERAVDLRFRPDRGPMRWLRSMIARLDDGRTPCGFVLDVTEQRQLESELAQAQKLESVGRLAAGVAHEINTPIQFVTDSVFFVEETTQALLRLVRAYQGAKPALAEAGRDALVAELDDAEATADLAYVAEHVPTALGRIQDGLARVSTIVRSMKEFAHPDTDERSAVDLNAAIDSTLVIARNEYKYVADVETDFGDVPSVSCFAGPLNQVVLNILVNAAHAIADVVAGTDERGTIRIRTRREGDDVVVRISDTGGGIPEAVRAKVFDPFFTTKAVGKGTGQGLAIARSVIVDKHGGALDFETELGVGTTFVLRIPIDAPPVAVAA